MITIGALAKTYHLLPSEVAARATTYDIMVMDVMAAWEEYQRSRADGTYVPEFKQEDLLRIVKEAKDGRGN